jgi:hypothetical protein
LFHVEWSSACGILEVFHVEHCGRETFLTEIRHAQELVFRRRSDVNCRIACRNVRATHSRLCSTWNTTLKKKNQEGTDAQAA